MRENNRNSIEKCRKKLPQFTTMNVIDGQAGLISYFSLIFYSLTIDNILNIIVLLILAAVSIATLTGNNGILTSSREAKFKSEVSAIREQLRLFLTEQYTYLDKEFKPKEVNGELTIIPDLEESLSNEYKNRINVTDGDLLYYGNNKQEIQWCIELGIRTSTNSDEVDELEKIIGDDIKIAIENKYVKRYQYPYQITGTLKTKVEQEIGRNIDYSKDRFYEVNEENVLGSNASGTQYIYDGATGDVIEITSQTNRIKGTWYWVTDGDSNDYKIMNDTEAQNQFFEKLAYYKINEIYIFQSSSKINTENVQLRNFVKNAYSKDIKSYLLVGDDDYLNDDEINKMIKNLYDDLDTYNRNVDYTERIAGVNYDAEVWLNDEYNWKENIETRNKHIQFITIAKEYADSKNLEAFFSIPFWLVQYDVTDNGTSINMFDKVTQILERISILAYRDTKDGIDSLILNKQSGASDSIINYISKNECILDIGVETSESSEGDKLTLYEEEKAALGTVNTVLSEVEKGYKNICDSFVFSIHHAEQLVEFQGGIDVQLKTKISTPEQLMNFLTSDKDYKDEVVELTNNIDMSGYENIQELPEKSFVGTFDGKGYTISNINMNVEGRAALFYEIGNGGVVKNLNIANSTFVSTDSRAGAIVGSNKGSIINCSNQKSNITGKTDVGGIAATNHSIIKNCFNTGNIIANKYLAGGIAGENAEGSKIYNSYSIGKTEAQDSSNGAIVGDCINASTLENVYWLTGSNKKGSGYHNDLAITKELTEEEMKSSDFIQTLNNNAKTDSELKSWKIVSGQNDGYPVFE